MADQIPLVLLLEPCQTLKEDRHDLGHPVQALILAVEAAHGRTEVDDETEPLRLPLQEPKGLVGLRPPPVDVPLPGDPICQAWQGRASGSYMNFFVFRGANATASEWGREGVRG